MKKIITLMFIFASITSCKTKQTECYRKFTLSSCQVAFSGFSAEEIDTVIINKYKAETGYNDLLQSDTIFISDPVIEGGVIYSATSGYLDNGFLTLEEGNDYRFIFPAVNNDYRISNITVPPLTDTFIVTGRDYCPMGTAGPWFTTVSCKVNGGPPDFLQHHANNFFIKIHR